MTEAMTVQVWDEMTSCNITEKDTTKKLAEISTVETLVAELQAGRPIVLVDDENRENEGDLVIAAEFATEEAITFMAVQGRGLICLALTQEMADQMELSMQPKRHVEKFSTNFTVSIEAKTGVASGISAADRAQTIKVATSPEVTADDIATPGHVFPIIARPNGTLERPGHTEATVDLARLAGLRPAGVICEVMQEDGTMARLDSLRYFAHRFDIKIGLICDLVAYRKRTNQ